MNWKELITSAVNDNDGEMIEMICSILREHEQAKQELRNKGYGHTGLSLIETIKQEVFDQTKTAKK